MRAILVLTFALLLSGAATSKAAEQLCPKYGECVPAAAFVCQLVTDSSVVTRVCYSAAKSYMIIGLKGVDYHYCEIDQGTVDRLLAAESKGKFYNAEIKDSGTGARFSCRNREPPVFQ